jgi:5'-methylthioadenosine phosphorylase
VTVEAIVKVLLENADKARALVKSVAPRVYGDASACECGCRSALQYAIITAPEARDPALEEKLSAVAGRMLKK